MEPTKPMFGVIARLMGLDQLPSQQPVQKKQRVLSENYLQKVASIGVRQKSPECHLFISGIEENKECSNVFHVVETLKRKKRCDMSVEKRKINSTSSSLMMPSTRVEWVSDDKTLQNFPQDTQQPYSLFTRKLNDVQEVPLQVGSRLITALNSCYASDCRDSHMFRKSLRMSEQLHVNLLKKFDDCLTPYASGLQGKNEFLGPQLKPNYGSCLSTARIVAQDPSTQKVGSTPRCFSPFINYYGESCLGDGSYSGTFIPQNRNVCAEGKEKKIVNNDTGLARPRSRFAKHITRKMGIGVSGMSTLTPKLRITSCVTLQRESELNIHSLPVMSDKKNQVCLSDKLYVPNEGKKQIYERWKTNKKFKEVESAGRNVTPVELLGIPAQESRRRNIESKPNEFGLRKQASPDRGIASCSVSLGISSKENKSKKLNSGQNNSLDHRNSDSNHKKHLSGSCLESGNGHPIAADYVFQEKSDGEDSCGETAANCKPSSHNNESLKDALVTQKEHKIEARNWDVIGRNSLVPLSSTSDSYSVVVQADTMSDTENEIVKAGESQQLATGNCMMSVKHEDYFSCALDPSVQQDIHDELFEEESAFSHCSDRDRELLMSLDEGYQPSPDSVLEPLFKKESSFRSDCFKSVNGSSLDGLQRELELLNSETSELYPQGSRIIVSSDEDSGSGSVGDFEENEDLMKFLRVEESRDYSYLVDILTEAGFLSRYPHVGFDASHCKERPISFSIFEALEKKYGDHIYWKRSERRLLFDRINLALMEVLNPSMGTPAWKKPVARRLCFGQGRQMIEEGLWMLMVCQKKEGSMDSPKVFGKDDKWLELAEDIEIIGREIENSLIDQLVEDVVGIESF